MNIFKRIFTLDKNRTYKLVNAMIDAGLNVVWSCETRLDALDKDALIGKLNEKLGNISPQEFFGPEAEAEANIES